MDESTVDRLASIASQLAARVRDDNAEANARWLAAVTTAEERDALLYVLAAAVPIDRSWACLTAWANAAERVRRRRASWRAYQRRQRTPVVDKPVDPSVDDTPMPVEQTVDEHNGRTTRESVAA